MIALAPVRKRRGARMGSGLYDELVVDLFAGGGGASVGIEAALGRAVDREQCLRAIEHIEALLCEVAP